MVVKEQLNHLRRTITSPALLLFYTLTVIGVWAVSSLVAVLVGLGPALGSLVSLFEESVERDVVFLACAGATATSVLVGQSGHGLTSLLRPYDENTLMSAPVTPRQVFVAGYFRRVTRRGMLTVLAMGILLPLHQVSWTAYWSAVTVVGTVVLLLEFNYLLGGLAATLRLKLERRSTQRRWQRAGLSGLLIIVMLSGSPVVTGMRPAWALPYNAVAAMVLKLSGVLTDGPTVIETVAVVTLGILAALSVLAHSLDAGFYELAVVGRQEEQRGGRVSRLLRGEVDFTRSRASDPVVWLMAKDFWTEMRRPLQVWKYIYVVVGTALSVVLNTTDTMALGRVRIPHELEYAAVPAMVFMLVLVVQLVSVGSLLGFVDERDMIYQLRASPLRAVDIVMAKYIPSVVEATLLVLPACGMVAYIFPVKGGLILLSLCAPLVIVFCAAGTMIGASVPVFTADPRTPPLPLALALPTINFVSAGIVIGVLVLAGGTVLALVALPAVTVSLTALFLGLGVLSLRQYR